MRRSRTLVALGLGLAVLAAACSDDSAAPPRPVVEVFGPIIGTSAERLGRVLRDASAGSGVELRYVGVTSFVEQLNDRLERGDRPGVALLPQPGLLDDLASRGVVQPLPAEVVAASGTDYPEGLVDLVRIDGVPAAVWLTVDVKGLVWYRPAELAARGLSVPATLDGLDELAEQVRASGSGVAPWCVTIEAGASTGWVGTDWVEDYVLRRLGPDTYGRWASGEVAFDSPEIASVFDELDRVLRRPGAMAGGSRAVLTTPWELAGEGLFASQPRCLLLRQADFIADSFPSGTTIGPDGDVDFFPVPPATAGEPAPLLLGGLLAAALADAPGVSEAMAILASDEVAGALAATGDFLSPHAGVDRAAIVDPTDRRLLDLVLSTPVVRFDASDLMPATVGTGTFWSGMRAFLGGEPVSTVLEEIQAGWADTDPPSRG